MNNPMNLINLKMATAVAAVLTMVASLAPEAAQAQRFGFASQPNNRPPNNSPGQTVSFDFNTSVPDSNPDPNVGNYNGAIENFSDTNTPVLSFNSGNLSASRFDIPSDPNANVTGPGGRNFDFTFNDLINEPNVLSANESFKNGGLRYEVTFNDDPNVILTLFIPSTDPGLINSLSGVSQFTSIPGVVSRGVNNDEIFGNFANRFPNSQPFTFQDSTVVPEPDATAGMLALGGLGTISLLRRNRRSSIHLSNRNATGSSKAGRG